MAITSLGATVHLARGVELHCAWTDSSIESGASARLIMVDLTLELCTGREAVRTREIMRVCDEAHRQRGGAETPLKSSF